MWMGLWSKELQCLKSCCGPGSWPCGWACGAKSCNALTLAVAQAAGHVDGPVEQRAAMPKLLLWPWQLAMWMARLKQRAAVPNSCCGPGGCGDDSEVLGSSLVQSKKCQSATLIFFFC